MTQWTQWLAPRTAEYAETDSVQFVSLNTGQDIISSEPVQGVARSQGGLTTEETSAILFRDFAVSGSVTGVVLELRVSRLGRVQDRLIRLRNSQGWLSSDLSVLTAEDHHAYTVSDISVIANADLGFVIDLGPHSEYPSRDTVYIRSVRARFCIE